MDYCVDCGVYNFFIISPLECKRCAMPEGVITATEIVISNSSTFLTIPNGRYDLVIIDAVAITKPYFSVRKTFWELKIYHVIVTCVNSVCCIHYILIFSLCVFSLCRNLKTNLFISSVLSTFLCWIQKKSLFD